MLTYDADCREVGTEWLARRGTSSSWTNGSSENRQTYDASGYNETQLRREFIDPLFKALGWDMDNEQGLAEAYKDVIHEDAIKVGGSTKAPDYCFRIGGTRKFFVEAKRPSVAIGSDPAPAYQVRRYAWSNKLPLSVVTDFDVSTSPVRHLAKWGCVACIPWIAFPKVLRSTLS